MIQFCPPLRFIKDPPSTLPVARPWRVHLLLLNVNMHDDLLVASDRLRELLTSTRFPERV